MFADNLPTNRESPRTVPAVLNAKVGTVSGVAAANYTLRCSDPFCGREYAPGDDLRMYCDGELTGAHKPALLRAVYSERRIRYRSDLPGVFQYGDWLPSHHWFRVPGYDLGKPFCYKSEGLAKSLKLRNLYIAFSGYWPERGANLITRSFKEFEVQASLGRFFTSRPFGSFAPLIVASAGNTGSAYSFMATLLGLRLYLVIPETGLCNLSLPLKSTARILTVRGNYSDAIQLADDLRPLLEAQSDGGVRNVARRAGMATVYVNAVVHPHQGIQTLFDHYFQAIGSGAGAIAAWEAVENLMSDGRFGKTRTRIHVAQNEPFTPIPDAWNQQSRALPCYSAEERRLRIASVTASVLSNQNPPYSLPGGVYDVLAKSRGAAWKVNNFEAFDAAGTFRETEGVDVAPAGAVAVGALIKAVACNQVSAHDRILLHITGGGREIQDRPVYPAEPAGVVDPGQVHEALALLQDAPELCARMK